MWVTEVDERHYLGTIPTDDFETVVQLAVRRRDWNRSCHPHSTGGRYFSYYYYTAVSFFLLEVSSEGLWFLLVVCACRSRVRGGSAITTTSTTALRAKQNLTSAEETQRPTDHTSDG